MYKKYRHHKVHRKNWVVFSLLFLSASLLTTGLASFVVAQTKKNNQQGEVKVGVVNDTHVHFSNLEFVSDLTGPDGATYKNLITFDADANDNSGRVQHDTGFGREHRKVTLTGKVGPMTYINTCTYQLSIPQSVQDAIDIGYIELARSDGGKYDASKDYILAPQDIQTSKPSEEDAKKDEAAFSITCGFNWGKYFNNVNPCFYYDDKSDDGGGNKSDDEVVKEMNEFRRIRYYGKNSDTQLPTDSSSLPKLEFKITLTAKTSLS